MKIEEQVCSLNLAERLKELGVKQESVFRWSAIAGFAPFIEYIKEHRISTEFGESVTLAAAFTVPELGEMLPDDVTSSRLVCKGDTKPTWFVENDNTGDPRPDFGNRCYTDENKANCRAEMLIYLLEKKLIR